MNPTAANQLFRRLDRELWLVTACHGAQRGGLIATAVMSASIVPTAPRVLVAISRQHATWELVEASSRFTLQLLPVDALPLFERFAMHSSREIDKFHGLDWENDLSGGPRWKQSIGWLDCRVEAQFDTGDRTLYLAEIVAAQAPEEETKVLTAHHLFDQAPAEWMPTIREQLTADAAQDLSAIEAWRQRTSLPSP